MCLIRFSVEYHTVQTFAILHRKRCTVRSPSESHLSASQDSARASRSSGVGSRRPIIRHPGRCDKAGRAALPACSDALLSLVRGLASRVSTVSSRSVAGGCPNSNTCLRLMRHAISLTMIPVLAHAMDVEWPRHRAAVSGHGLDVSKSSQDDMEVLTTSVL